MFHVIAKNSLKVLAIGAGAIATAVVLKRTGTDAKIAEVARKVANGTVDVATIHVDLFAAAGETVISSADKAVEAAAYGVGVTTRAALDLGSKAGSKASKNNPVSRGFRAGFYRPETKACAVLASAATEAQPATQG